MRVLALLSAFLVLTAVAQSSSPEAEFIARYRKAHSDRDIAVLKSLRCLDRVPADDQSASDARFYNLDQAITSIRIVPANRWPIDGPCCDSSALFVRDGVRYELNLPVVAALQIEYTPGENSSRSESASPLGFKDCRYWLLSAVPASN